jgi:hypothetical protein
MRERIQNYIFTPGVGGSGTIKFAGYVETADILVITNVTTNTIIYQFSDPNKGATVSYNPGTDVDYPTSQNGITTITLSFNTSLMNANDKLQVYVETREVTVRPWHFGTDSIERMRMAQPESLIDADFEYGLQNTKWQSISLNNNMPAIYESPGADLVLDIEGYATLVSGTHTISSSSTTQFAIANQSGQATPSWRQNDYALLINQTNVSPTSASITSEIFGSQQRTFNFSGNAAPFSIGDLVLITGIQAGDSDTTLSANITSTATTTVNITGANSITAGSFIQVQTDTAGVWELMAVLTAAGGTLTVVRQRNGTNPSGANLTSGNDVKLLSNIEIGRVQHISSDTEMEVTRGWYNTIAVDHYAVGTQIQKINQGDGANGNLEIVKLTTVNGTAGSNVTVQRSSAGSVAKNSSALSGSILVRMVGVFQAGTPLATGTGGLQDVAQIGINTPVHGLLLSEYISTQNHQNPDSEGLYFVSTSDVNNIFYYPKKSSGLQLGTPLNQYDTVIRKSIAYTGAEIPIATVVSDGQNPSTITVTSPYAHGLSPGTPLLVNMIGTNASIYGSGPFVVLSVPTLTTFTLQAKRGAAITGTLAATMIIKPNAYYVHRPFDGGIAMTCGSPHHGATAARQTKKYFRYQSGKGMFFTSGTLFAPTFDIAQCSASGTTAFDTITVVTEQNHQLQIGAIVRVSGIITPGYVGVRRVTQILSDRSFTVRADNALASTTPVFAPQPRINVVGWYGGTVRAGMFDEQNGLFWEYDGEQLNVVKRSSTYQVAGLVSVQTNSNLVEGDGTCRFQDQLKIGDTIVIRGMTHTVTSIDDQNTFTMIPEYRGVRNETRVKVLLTIDQRVPQSQFNVDIMDSTGPSGYLIDPAKMQMIMIQYTWYGAGFIEFGVRGPNGKMILAHRIKNNNINDEAYMRSGNLPCRYEAASTGALTELFGAIDDSQDYLQVLDGTFLPANVSVTYPVYLSVENEIVRYTGITKNVYGAGNTVANVTGLTRSSTLTQWIEGASRTFTQGPAVSHIDGSGVFVLGCTAAPTVTHWGSAVIMDGGFQGDQGFSFTFNRQNVALPSEAGKRITLFLMRLAPSVSNTIIGDLGTRDLVNRAELSLERLIVNLTGGRYLIEGVLNPNNVNLRTTTFENLNTTAYGNQPSFTQFSTNITFTDAGTGGGILPGSLSFSGTPPFRGPFSIEGATRSGSSRSRTVALVYSNVSGTSQTGAGSGVIIDVTVPANTTNYNLASIVVRSAGSGYRVGDQVLFSGIQLGGSTSFNLTVTLANVGSDELVVTNVEPTTVTGSGSGANISIRSLVSSANLTNYSQRTITYTVNSAGAGYQFGDTLKILGYEFGANAANVTNDMTLTVTSVSGTVTGGERLFAIPVSDTSNGELDLRAVKQLGTSAVPGNGVFPDGPEVLAVTITCIADQTVQQFADVQLSFTESQA